MSDLEIIQGSTRDHLSAIAQITNNFDHTNQEMCLKERKSRFDENILSQAESQNKLNSHKSIKFDCDKNKNDSPDESKEENHFRSTKARVSKPLILKRYLLIFNTIIETINNGSNLPD